MRRADASAAARSALAAAALAVAPLLGGCLGDVAAAVGDAVLPEALKPGPARLAAVVTAAGDVNPDIDGRPSPVRVRVLVLKADTALKTADFFTVFQNESVALGKDLLARDDLVLTPGEEVRLERDLAPEARVLGVLAAYQDLDNATWRATAPLVADARNDLAIAIGRLAVSIASRGN